MPAALEPGILYVAAEYGTAAHLCACGCGSKVRTPLGPTEWTLEEHRNGPTLEPSIGNWQRKCQSHYWIIEGNVHWAESWTKEQVASGRGREVQRRTAYYEDRQSRTLRGLWRRFVAWFGSWRLP